MWKKTKIKDIHFSGSFDVFQGIKAFSVIQILNKPMNGSLKPETLNHKPMSPNEYSNVFFFNDVSQLHAWVVGFIRIAFAMNQFHIFGERKKQLSKNKEI